MGGKRGPGLELPKAHGSEKLTRGFGEERVFPQHIMLEQGRLLWKIRACPTAHHTSPGLGQRGDGWKGHHSHPWTHCKSIHVLGPIRELRSQGKEMTPELERDSTW